MKTILFGVMALMATSSLASAAGLGIISDFGGSIRVNQGEGFIELPGQLELKAGDRIFVGEDSFASLSFESCTLSLTKPTVYTVPKVPDCKIGSDVVVSPTADVPSMPDTPVVYDPAGLPLLPMALLGVAGAGLGYLVITEVLDEHDCASPNGAC